MEKFCLKTRSRKDHKLTESITRRFVRAPVLKYGLCRAAFTLMEMLLVIALIGLVMGAVVMNSEGIFQSNARKMAGIAVTRSIPSILMSYRSAYGQYPEALEQAEEFGRVEKDPWGNDYQYRYPGKKNTESYDLWSPGPDGKNNTSDDITNWNGDADEDD